MPNTTTELGLTQPLSTEQYDVGIFNTNMDIVNEHVAGKGADIASAATISLPATLDGHIIDITGSTGPITAISTEPEGVEVIFQFDSTPTLTHNATSLDLGGQDITVVAGDYLRFLSRGAGNWGLTGFQPAGTHHLTQTLSNKTLTTPTIASFTNSTHNYTNAAGGGVLATIQIAFATGSTSAPTTTSSTFADLAEMNTTLTTTGGDLLVWFVSAMHNASSAVQAGEVCFQLDAESVVGTLSFHISKSTGSEADVISNFYRFAAPSSASHRVDVQWRRVGGAGSQTATGTQRHMLMLEVFP